MNQTERPKVKPPSTVKNGLNMQNFFLHDVNESDVNRVLLAHSNKLEIQ